MRGLKDFLVMTRHERRGSIVVLAVIAMILAMTAIVRSCPSDRVDAAQEKEMLQFQAEVDTAHAQVERRDENQKRQASKKKGHRSRSKKPKRVKPSPQPRRMDPVPQF